MTTTESSHNLPNWLGRMLFLALEEVTGKAGVSAVLNLSAMPAFIGNYPPKNDRLELPFGALSRIQTALELIYGPHGGRGLAVRTGRVLFSNGLRTLGADLGFNNPVFRLQSPDIKIGASLQALTDLFNRSTDQQITLEKTDRRYCWRIENCPWCWERYESEPVCHLAAGILQETLFWVSSGKMFNVVEESCAARGDSECLFVIDRTPLE